jgi:threonine/homoserine/homoserine lactone efflux protein
MSGSWGSVLGQLVPLALVVAMSPLSIVPAVVLVLHSGHPRPTGLAFLAGWLVGLAATTTVFVQVPRLLEGRNVQAPPWVAWVRIVGGVLLIALGAWRWATRQRSTGPPAWLNRIARITPVSAAATGVGLILVNPKVLVMNAAAGLIIGTAELGVPGTWLAVTYYTVLAGSSVAIPILAYFVAGERVDHQLEQIKEWMQRQHAVLTAGILAVIGLALLYTGIRALT